MLEMFKSKPGDRPKGPGSPGGPGSSAGRLVSRGTVIDLCYLIAAITFILALKGLSSPKHARRGTSSARRAWALAIGPLLPARLSHIWLIVIAMVIGVVIAVPVARLVKMTAMPQLAPSSTAWRRGGSPRLDHRVHRTDTKQVATYKVLEVLLGVLIGSVSFAGSAIAFIKLQELITGRPITYPGQQVINGIVGVIIVALVFAILVTSSTALLWVLLGFSLVLGVISCSPSAGRRARAHLAAELVTGVAVAASGFTLNNNLLIVAGTLVGAQACSSRA